MASEGKLKEDVQQAPVSGAINLSAQVDSLVLAYHAAYLERTKVLVNSAMPDLKEHLAKNDNLITPMYADGKLGPDDCTDALAEIKSIWPWVHEAIGNTTVLCHIIKSFRAHKVEIPRGRLAGYMVTCCDTLQKTFDFSPETYEMVGKSTLKEVTRRFGSISDPMGGNASAPTIVKTHEDAARSIELIAEDHKHGIAIAVQNALSTVGVDAGTEPLDKSGSPVDKDGELHTETLGEALTNYYTDQFKGADTAAKKSAAYFREKGVKAAAEQKVRDERKG